jgi:hypothetical protein
MAELVILFLITDGRQYSISEYKLKFQLTGAIWLSWSFSAGLQIVVSIPPVNTN